MLQKYNCGMLGSRLQTVVQDTRLSYGLFLLHIGIVLVMIEIIIINKGIITIIQNNRGCVFVVKIVVETLKNIVVYLLHKKTAAVIISHANCIMKYFPGLSLSNTNPISNI